MSGRSLIIIDGPYRNHTARKRRRKRIQVALILAAVVLLTLFLAHSLRAIVRNTDAQIRAEWPSWLSEEEAKRLQKFHGVPGLQVGENTVEILRDGEWVVVKKKGGKP